MAKISHIFQFSLLCCTALVTGMLFYLQQQPLIDFSVFENYDPGIPSVLLDDADQEWARFDLDRREPVKLAGIPDCVINAFIATEDREFFQHPGVSVRGMIRSMWVNLKSGRKLQGASTITQQLVKLLYLDGRKTFARKIKEQLVALVIERKFTKQQILEIYLNHVYFGCGIYGVEAASRRFFGCSVAELQPHHAATLAAVIKSPAQYCPLLCPLSALKRRDLILGLMRQNSYLDQVSYEFALKQPLGIVPGAQLVLAPHLKETIRTYLEAQLGKQLLYTGGLRIRTTLNQRLQKLAQQQFTERLKALRADLNPALDGGLLTMDVKTGEIRALVGGYDFSKSKFNRALQARRQMGSVFKPLIYTVALQQGASFADLEVDEPFQLELHGQLWTPQNNTQTFEGPMTLARALSVSNNIVAIKTLLKHDPTAVVALAQRLRLQSVTQPYPSIALGCVDVTLKEVAGAFNVFANGGVYVEPHYLKWVKDRWGRKIWRQSVVSERVLSLPIVTQVAQVLRIGIERFLKLMHNQTFKTPAIGKTGTTNDSRTCWFAGATPNYTTVIYVGTDQNSSLGRNIYAVATAFPIWLGIHAALTEPATDFAVAAELQPTWINWRTGVTVSDQSDPEAVLIYR